MNIFEMVGSEHHPSYQSLEIANGTRQYDFLRSLVAASIEMQRPFLSSEIIKALNFHAITCLHAYAGQYRPCKVTVGGHEPPPHYLVQPLMDDFINSVNRVWEVSDPIALAALVLWRLNFIHPFINGNGRTARAACYYVLCVNNGGWIAGAPILPELIRRDRKEYCDILAAIDASVTSTGNADIKPLYEFLRRLLAEQLGSAAASPASP